MAGPEGFEKRLFDAWLRLQQREESSVSQKEIALRVSRILGREPPLVGSAVNKWFKDGVIPDVPTMAALAQVLGGTPICDPGWLAFGDLSRAPTPRDPGIDGMEELPQRETREG